MFELIIKTEDRNQQRYGLFIVNFEQIWHIIPVFSIVDF